MKFENKEEEELYNEGVKFYPELNVRSVFKSLPNNFERKWFLTKTSGSCNTEKFKRVVALRKLELIYIWVEKELKLRKSVFSKSTESIYLRTDVRNIRLSCHKAHPIFKGTQITIEWNSYIPTVIKTIKKYASNTK